MFLLFFLADTATLPASPGRLPVEARSSATASVRIERAQAVTAQQWEQQQARLRREIHRTDETGRPIVIRLIEHE